MNMGRYFHVADLFFCVYILCAGCSSMHDVDRETVELPNNTSLDVTEVLYRLEKPTSLMGDGYAALIAVVSPKAIQDYVDTHATEQNGWRRGSVQEYDPKLVDFLSHWAKVKNVYGTLHESEHVWDRLRSEDAVFWTYKEFKRTGRLRNGILFVILPSEHMLIMLRQDT